MFFLRCKELKHSGVSNVKVIFDEKYSSRSCYQKNSDEKFPSEFVIEALFHELEIKTKTKCTTMHDQITACACQTDVESVCDPKAHAVLIPPVVKFIGKR